jgi:hypothetical protein
MGIRLEDSMHTVLAPTLLVIEPFVNLRAFTNDYLCLIVGIVGRSRTFHYNQWYVLAQIASICSWFLPCA